MFNVYEVYVSNCDEYVKINLSDCDEYVKINQGTELKIVKTRKF